MKKHTNKYWQIVSLLQPWIFSFMIVFFAWDVWNLRSLKSSVEAMTKSFQEAVFQINEEEANIESIPDLDTSPQGIITALTNLEKKIEKLSRHYQPIYITYVTITAYTPSVNECDSDPQHTAIMTKPKPGTIAISRDLLEAGWTFGKRVWIKNHGVFVINDLMNKRYKNRIDIVMFDKNQAIQFGKRESIAVLIQQT